MMPQRRSSEVEIWRAHLAVLTEDVRRRGPEGIARVRSERARLEREVEAMNARRKLAERSADAGGGMMIADQLGLVEQLGAAIADRLRRVSDLAGLLRVKSGWGATDEDGPSAEASIKPARIDPIDLLHGKGKLTDDQYRAAREIAWVYEAITRAGRARVSRLSQIEAPKGWQEVPLPERAAFVHAKRFVPWTERLRVSAPAALDIVMRLAVFGAAVYPVARKHRLGWSSCVARLGDGLDEYGRGVGGRG